MCSVISNVDCVFLRINGLNPQKESEYVSQGKQRKAKRGKIKSELYEEINMVVIVR